MESYCKKELLALGWTEGAINRFLPAPRQEWRRHYHGDYVVYLWPKELVDGVRQTKEVVDYLDRVRERNRKRDEREPRVLPLLDAIREISRAAHRWRDAASAQHSAGNYGLATSSSRNKRYFYDLKERGIAAAFKQGLLRYAGQTPQGMALYEYGEGGMSCFHSCLHPVGLERPMVESHPETLFVPAKKQKEQVQDAEHTLLGFSVPGEEFERSNPPSMKRPVRSVTCWNCGDEGHVATGCPDAVGA